ncbi:unnamed protein product [Dicrocoelium dendriticum]|nr:unnamed protein product [Dicrocoelium dendriticum]
MHVCGLIGFTLGFYNSHLIHGMANKGVPFTNMADETNAKVGHTDGSGGECLRGQSEDRTDAGVEVVEQEITAEKQKVVDRSIKVISD